MLPDKSWELLAELPPSSIPRSSVPVIIFQESTRNLPEAKIDLVVRNLEPPGEWLNRIAEVLADSNRGDSKSYGPAGASLTYFRIGGEDFHSQSLASEGE